LKVDYNLRESAGALTTHTLNHNIKLKKKGAAWREKSRHAALRCLFI